MTDPAAADLGTLEAAGDRWTLRFTRTFPHPIELVWAAVTEPEHLAVWFPQRIEGERRAGAPLRFVTSGDDEGDGTHQDAFEGTMLAFDPPHVMAFSWGEDSMRIELEPDDSGGTRLTLTDTFAELGKAARDAAGWHECLVLLEADLTGAPLPEPGSIWEAVHRVYVEHLGPAASSIGPPAG